MPGTSRQKDDNTMPEIAELIFSEEKQVQATFKMFYRSRAVQTKKLHKMSSKTFYDRSGSQNEQENRSSQPRRI